MRSLIQFWVAKLTMVSKISLMAYGETRSRERQCSCAVLRVSKIMWQSLSNLRQEIKSLVRVCKGRVQIKVLEEVGEFGSLVKIPAGV